MMPKISTPWDAEGLTTLYATPDEDDTMTMIEIRANVTEAGWHTVAFIEAIWPDAKRDARLIAALPHLLAALRAIASDRDACTCHMRSWYGKRHDTQCPLRIARDALAKATRN
jgi:hypothetical protein